MLPVEIPFKVYTGRDGKPLNHGYVYFGVPNLNPQTSPVTVYWDAAGTQPAAQPLRTENGYIMRAGTPANVYFNGTYSELILDSKRRQVAFVRSSDDFSIASFVYSFISSLAASTGAALIGFKLNAIGSIARLMSDKSSDVISSDDFSGMDKTGATDCATAWNAAFTATRLQGAPAQASRPLVIRSGTYKLNGAVTVGSYQRIVFEPGVVIDASGLPNEITSVFTVSNQEAVYMEGNGTIIKGARATAAPAVEGNSCAFFLFGSSNVHLKNFQIQDFATDGITIDGDNTASGPCTNVIIEGCTATTSRRNGLSVISVKGLTVIGGEYSFSSGAPVGPWAGIDIEPNDNSFCEDVMLINVRTTGNIGAGIQVTPGAMSVAGAASTYFDVTIIGGRSLADGGIGANNRAGLLFANGGTQLNQVFGQVHVDGFIVDGPVGRGVGWFNWDADKCPLVTCNRVSVYNPDYLTASITNFDRSGFVISCGADQAITNLGNILLRNCRAIDKRGVAWMTWGMLTDAAAGKTIKNVTIIDPVSTNIVDSAKLDVHTFAAGGAGLQSGVDVIYTRPTPLTVSADTPLAKYVGKRLNMTATSVQTLPNAANCKDSHFEIQVAAGVVNLSVTPPVGDKILYNGLAVSAPLVIKGGAYLSIRSLGGTSWLAESFNGQV